MPIVPYEINAIINAARNVFENNDDAMLDWFYKENAALGGNSPAEHCKTDKGKIEVRRLLSAIEYGNSV